MALVQVNVDYYAVLEIFNTATLENITKSYRRLVKIRHPDRNINKDDSTAVFQLVSPYPYLVKLPALKQSRPLTRFMKLQNAYETLSDPEKRRAYDAQWKGIRHSLRAKQVSDRRRAMTAAAENRRKLEEANERQARQNAQKRHVQELENTKSVYCDDIVEVHKMINKTITDLKRLEDYGNEQYIKQQEKPAGWLLYLASLFHCKIEETQEQKQAREIEQVQRDVAKTTKQSELLEQEAKLQKLQDALEKVQIEIEREKKTAVAEKLAETKRAAAEAAATAEATTRKTRQTPSSRKPSSPGNPPASSSRTSFDASKSGSGSGSGSAGKGLCQHQRFWPKVEGRQHCRRCRTFQRLFAFECPDCGTIACASCRQFLRGEEV